MEVNTLYFPDHENLSDSEANQSQQIDGNVANDSETVSASAVDSKRMKQRLKTSITWEGLALSI